MVKRSRLFRLICPRYTGLLSPFQDARRPEMAELTNVAQSLARQDPGAFPARAVSRHMSTLGGSLSSSIAIGWIRPVSCI